MSNIKLFYGYWDYWQLYHKVTFDGVNKLIIINKDVTELNFQRDVYSAWKEWLLLEQNTKYPQALRIVGGEPTVQGQFLDATFFLLNGWRFKPQPGSYTLTITGNVFDVDGGEIFVPADINLANPNNININTNTSVIVRRVETGSVEGGLTQEQSESLFTIEDKVFQIENTLSQPIQAQLAGDQDTTLTDIQQKVLELWKIHGLDPEFPTLVSKEGRVVDDIVQIFSEDGVDITITRA